MENHIKPILKQIMESTSLYYPLRNWAVKRRLKKEFVEWQRNGRSAPPPHLVKQQTLESLATSFGLKILVETGTYYGDMVEAMKGRFDRIYSIELSEELHEKAKKRVKGLNDIELICGDSAIELGNVMKSLDRPALFWLDGHYSGGATAKGDKNTPIYEELNHILNAPDRGHVVVIDDARCFGKDPDYPSIEELTDFVRSRRPNVNIAVQNDIIRITPIRRPRNYTPPYSTGISKAAEPDQSMLE